MESKTLKFYVPVCFQMGKALRQGDTESFLLEYDKVLHDLDAEGCNSPAVQLDDIKEMARVISDLPTYQYSVIEQGYIEGLLTSIISGEFSSADLAILELLEYLPLAADSGVSSDHDTETIEIASTSTCQGDDSQLDLTDVTSDAIDECNTKKKDSLIPPDNLIANKEQGLLPLSKKIVQGTASPAASSNLQLIEKDSISAGLHMYCNGDIIKMSDEESSLSFISKKMYPKNRKRASSFCISDSDYHRKCVDLLWKNWCSVNKEISEQKLL